VKSVVLTSSSSAAWLPEPNTKIVIDESRSPGFCFFEPIGGCLWAELAN
jgi:hypothetical protein